MSGIAKTVGQRLRNYRTKRGWSQEKLSELAGFHPTYIGQVERGEKNLTLESLEKICQALDLSLSALFEGMGPDPEADSLPLKCYELVARADEKTQTHMHRVLSELSEMARRN